MAGYASYTLISAKLLERRVSAVIPEVCDRIRAQRATIVKAIEAYRSSFGFYPPDNVLSEHPLSVDAENNPLIYELAGVVYNRTNDGQETKPGTHNTHKKTPDAKHPDEKSKSPVPPPLAAQLSQSHVPRPCDGGESLYGAA